MAHIHILLAEDDEDDQIFFQDALRKAGIQAELTMVENGNELLDALAKIENPPPPDMIFVDINMPLKNGKECLKEIREERKFDAIPVIMISTSSHPRDIEDTYQSGATRYINKTSFFMSDVQSINDIFATDWQTAMKNPTRDNFLMS